MKNKGTKQKLKKKGSDNAFGCDLIEHLQSSGQDVPQVLKKCAEFIEKHGIVDGIYRLSGVTSNIQRLRQEFCSEACPDLTKEVYLQDIHCVGSLCKLYFRELPNPLLTFELYSKFTELVSVQGDHERLVYIQRVIRELPSPHFRTLEYLTKHLAHLGTLSAQTNMHTRNLALVWAPNLLRSKNIESAATNGDMAFQEVRIQQSVIEFILNHSDQIFSCGSVQLKPREGPGLKCGEKYATLPISAQCSPMKLMSLEEAQARSLSPNHPVHKERQRENSLPNTSTATLYHTVIDITDSKRKFSGKSKRWKSIFNLGRSVESKGKLSRNGSVFIRAQGITGKAALRPSRSMESLCSLPTDEDRTGTNSAAGGQGGIFLPDVKSRTLGSDYDLDEQDQNWDFKGKKSSSGGQSSGPDPKCSPGASASPQKTLPEQLKVFKGDDLSGYKPTSPKNRRMLYSGSAHSSTSRPSFPGSFFPLESSPRHQRRAVNISEPFAVSVPLRVSAVISSNSTPCRSHAKEKAATLKPCRETTSEQNVGDGKTNSLSEVEPKKTEGAERKSTEESGSAAPSEGSSREAEEEVVVKVSSPGEEASPGNAKESEEGAPSAGEEVSTIGQLEKQRSTEQESCSDLHQELKITEPDIQLLHDTFRPLFGSRSEFEVTKLTMDVKSKRSRSSPSLTLLCREQSSNTSTRDGLFTTGVKSASKQPSESDILFSLHKNFGKNSEHSGPADGTGEKEERREPVTSDRDEPGLFQTSQRCSQRTGSDPVASGPESGDQNQDQRLFCDGAKKAAAPELESVQRLSVCLEERRDALELLHLDDDDGGGGNSEELDLVEPWEDLSSTKQWVTSPLHSPDVEELFRQLSPFGCGSEDTTTSPPPTGNDKHLAECPPESVPQTSSSKPDTKWRYLSSAPSRVHANATQPHTGKCSGTKQKNPAPSHRFHRQTSHEGSVLEKREENSFPKHRPCSLNLDLGYRCIRDISNQQNRHLSEFSLSHRGLTTSSGSVNNAPPSDLEMFLNDRQAPLRRNSAPVSVSSVRTPLMIKTCQAKAVPVVAPKVQYSLIPPSRQEKEGDASREPEKEYSKVIAEKSPSAPPQLMSDLREELENKEPRAQKHTQVEKSGEAGVKATSPPELPVIIRRHAPSLEVFVDCPRASRGSLLQRPSFRNRQRPQSLILLSPPFPIMDYPSSGDDGKLLSSIRDAPAVNVLSAESLKAADGIPLQNKMTIPKSGQRLETSTSCFYQPQRRSMIFDSRSHRQIE